MTVKCKACGRQLDDRKDVRWEMRGAVLCSLQCIWNHRGKQRLV